MLKVNKKKIAIILRKPVFLYKSELKNSDLFLDIYIITHCCNQLLPVRVYISML